MSARVAIFTPTQRPGIDVTHCSILRQETEAKLLWLVADELYEERREVFEGFASRDHAAGVYEYDHFMVARADGSVRNLAAAYNKGIEKARSWGADLFISLQDYIWVPRDGVQKFVDMWRFIELENNDIGIYTGICSISEDPYDDQIGDINNMYSIFKNHYWQRPETLDWLDVRYRHDDGALYHRCPEIEWETNFACIPYHALYDERLKFDTEFDKAVAFENQDYAYCASKAGYLPYIDMRNRVISLPHKRYFADEWAREKQLTEVNCERVKDKWVHGA